MGGAASVDRRRGPAQQSAAAGIVEAEAPSATAAPAPGPVVEPTDDAKEIANALAKAIFEHDDETAKHLFQRLPDKDMVIFAKPPHTAMQLAARMGGGDLVRALAAAGANVSFGDASPLCMAVSQQNTAAVEALLALGAEPNPVGTAYHPVTVALDTKSVPILRLLLKHGSSPNAVTTELGRSAVHAAVAEQQTEAAAALMEAGANVNAADSDGWTPLLTAVQAEDVPAVEALLAAGADVNAVASVHAMDALMVAVECVLPDVVRVLVRHGADTERRSRETGRRALGTAAHEGDARVVRALVEAGARLEARARDGKTALHIAAGEGQTAAVEALLEAGADVDARVARRASGSGGAGGGGAAAAAKAGRGAAGAEGKQGGAGDAKLDGDDDDGDEDDDDDDDDDGDDDGNNGDDDGDDGDGDDERGAGEGRDADGPAAPADATSPPRPGPDDPPGLVADGDTPLILAAAAGRSRVVQQLLEAGADVRVRARARGRAGGAARVRTALSAALEAGRMREADMVLAAGGGRGGGVLTGTGAGGRALCRAAMCGSVAMVRYLLRCGVPPGAGDGTAAALFSAIQGGSEAVTCALLGAGADPDVPGAEEEDSPTPLYYACTEKEWAMVPLLLRARAAPDRGVRSGSRRLATPLYVAVSCGEAQTARALLSAGADPLAPDSTHRSPISCALSHARSLPRAFASERTGHYACVHALLSCGGSLQRPAADGAAPDATPAALPSVYLALRFLHDLLAAAPGAAWPRTDSEAGPSHVRARAPLLDLVQRTDLARAARPGAVVCPAMVRAAEHAGDGDEAWGPHGPGFARVALHAAGVWRAVGTVAPRRSGDAQGAGGRSGVPHSLLWEAAEYSAAVLEVRRRRTGRGAT